jgi:hypothetical protein
MTEKRKLAAILALDGCSPGTAQASRRRATSFPLFARSPPQSACNIKNNSGCTGYASQEWRNVDEYPDSKARQGACVTPAVRASRFIGLPIVLRPRQYTQWRPVQESAGTVGHGRPNRLSLLFPINTATRHYYLVRARRRTHCHAHAVGNYLNVTNQSRSLGDIC